MLTKTVLTGRNAVTCLVFVAKNWFGVDLWGNAIDLLDSASAQGWEVHRMPTEANPKAGATFVQSVPYHQFGHTGIVIEDSDGYTMRTVEQNIDGNADALYVGAPARFNTRDFTGVVGWFYPPYQGIQSRNQSAPSRKLLKRSWRQQKQAPLPLMLQRLILDVGQA
ncbi:cell wall hydrolase, lysin - phage associated [Streptococcus pyogenes]|nr:cell wall hydrolase, lysin - phage associated [Streptococcus pyogenes]